MPGQSTVLENKIDETQVISGDQNIIEDWGSALLELS